jgi:predicted phosphodiesterase
MNLKYENLALGFIGDIHGEFQKLQQIVKPFENTVFIICGDCGFGFPDTKSDKLTKMIQKSFKAFLEKRNIYLLFVRGNHDDPRFFDEVYDENPGGYFGYERFRPLPDYSVVTVNKTVVLCVGGAVSVDRRFRKVNSSYWYNEEVLPFQKMNFNPDILCSHTINRNKIAYLLRNTPDWLKISFKEDKKLYPDTERENIICEQLYNYYKPKYWIHGHYHISNQMLYNECKIISLGINELYEFRN